MKLHSLVLATVVMFCGPVMAQSLSERFDSSTTSAEEQRAKKETTILRCSETIGSVAIAPPDKNWWSQVQLQSPDALIKMFVARSGCFTIVDRGRGFAIAQSERALASSGNLQQGSNIGGGQMRAADYVITPDVVVSNNNSGGNFFGGILGAFIPGLGGAIASNISLSDKSANVTLSVTDVRTSEQIIMAEGKATKTDIGFGVGGGAFMGGGFGAVGAGSYENTALGQVVAMAYLDAYSQMVERIQSLRGVVSPVAELPVEVATVIRPQPQQAVAEKKERPVATTRKAMIYRGPSERSGSIREVPPGTILYPTNSTSDTWWEVADDSGAKGWISTRMLQLGR